MERNAMDPHTILFALAQYAESQVSFIGSTPIHSRHEKTKAGSTTGMEEAKGTGKVYHL
jgi:hypothetical protein